MLDCNNSFWHFSLTVYAKPGVADECLALQSRFNIDVNALLYCAWIGNAYKVRLTDEQLNNIDAHVRLWHRTIVRPLRAARQDIKPMPAMADDAVKDLRLDIARVELRAEQIEQAMLFEFTRGLISNAAVTSPTDAVRHNVMALLRQAMATEKTAGIETPKADQLVTESITYRPA